MRFIGFFFVFLPFFAKADSLKSIAKEEMVEIIVEIEIARALAESASYCKEIVDRIFSQNLKNIYQKHEIDSIVLEKNFESYTKDIKKLIEIYDEAIKGLEDLSL